MAWRSAGSVRSVTGQDIATHVAVAAILPAMREALRADAEGRVEATCSPHSAHPTR
jgi:hypothetical protein